MVAQMVAQMVEGGWVFLNQMTRTLRQRWPDPFSCQVGIRLGTDIH